tara:strand:+ start:84 stop:359 length:276 start_codon:yes stop_codon:yes gene_type:complete
MKFNRPHGVNSSMNSIKRIVLSLIILMMFGVGAIARLNCFNKGECHSPKVSIYQAGNDQFELPEHGVKKKYCYSSTIEIKDYGSFQGEVLD